MEALSKYSDIHTGWHMEDGAWRQEWVKDAFHDLQELWTTKMEATDTPSCRDIDLAMVQILDKHRKGDAAAYQSIFVALMFRMLDAKAHDDCGQRPCWLLSHGWKSRCLSLFMAKLLEEDTLPSLLEMYHDAEAKKDVLAFFGSK